MPTSDVKSGFSEWEDSKEVTQALKSETAHGRGEVAFEKTADFVKGLPTQIGKRVDSFKTSIGNAGSWIGERLQKVGKSAGASAMEAGKTAFGTAFEATENAKDAARSGMNAAGQAFEKGKQSAVDNYNRAEGAVWNAGQATIEGAQAVGSAVTEGGKKVGNAVVEGGRMVMAGAEKAQGFAAKAGREGWNKILEVKEKGIDAKNKFFEKINSARTSYMESRRIEALKRQEQATSEEVKKLEAEMAAKAQEYIQLDNRADVLKKALADVRTTISTTTAAA